MIKLESIKRSQRKDKKLTATFKINNKKKTVHFGQKNASDYTIHKDSERKKRYQARHINDNIDKPLSAGALSWFILWNKPTIRESITDYKKRFNIQ